MANPHVARAVFAPQRGILIGTPLLAIDGGPKVRASAFPPWPHYEPDEIEAVATVLRSGKVNQWTGPEVGLFEKEFATKIGAPHAIALANGTVAIELALRALGIGSGDDVVVPARTFVATASAVVAVGARPLCADVDPDSGNVTAATLEAALTPATRAVIVVHLGGWPCEMDDIVALCDRRDLFLLEDCAQANGATYRGRHVGMFGDVGCFSFCQDKIITTGGEGGAVVTADTALFERMWSYKDHGKSYAAVHRREHPPGFRWLHESFGTNWRMTGIQAAIGRAQLVKLDAWVGARRANAQRITKWLSAEPALRVPVPPSHMRVSCYRQYAYVDRSALKAGWTRDRIVAALSAEGIPSSIGSCGEIYREKAFLDRASGAFTLPHAHALHESSLAFVTHPTMTDPDADDTGRAVAKVFAEATRS